jgi:hypothetical protein
MVPYYEHYKLALQILQWRRPGGRLILKDPCHLWHTSALLRVFPDARIIHLHRSLLEALPSMASLCFSLHRVETSRTDPRAMAAYCMPLAERGLYSAMRLRSALGEDRFLDIPYRTLISTPAETVRRICDAIGSPAGDAELSQMMRWLEDNRQHKAGRHTYSLEQFGFERDRVADTFRRYHEAFLPEGG